MEFLGSWGSLVELIVLGGLEASSFTKRERAASADNLLFLPTQ